MWFKKIYLSKTVVCERNVFKKRLLFTTSSPELILYEQIYSPSHYSCYFANTCSKTLNMKWLLAQQIYSRENKELVVKLWKKTLQYIQFIGVKLLYWAPIITRHHPVVVVAPYHRPNCLIMSLPMTMFKKSFIIHFYEISLITESIYLKNHFKIERLSIPKGKFATLWACNKTSPCGSPLWKTRKTTQKCWTLIRWRKVLECQKILSFSRRRKSWYSKNLWCNVTATLFNFQKSPIYKSKPII